MHPQALVTCELCRRPSTVDWPSQGPDACHRAEFDRLEIVPGHDKLPIDRSRVRVRPAMPDMPR